VDRVEARAILDAKLAALRKLSYAELASRFAPVKRRYTFLGFTLTISGAGGRENDVEQAEGTSGAFYNVETHLSWLDDEGKAIDVIVSVSDASSRGFMPAQETDGFAIASDGSLVGE
jgi:hypothetical protein